MTANSYRCVLITGSRGQLGTALVRACRARGWRVVEHWRDGDIAPDKSVGDLRDRATVDGLLAAANAAGVDTVVLNAASTVSGRLEELGADEIDELVTTNVTATAQIASGLARLSDGRMRTIVLISSVATLTPVPGNVVYGATKAAQARLLEGLVLEQPGLSLIEAQLGAFADDLASLDPYFRDHPQLVEEPTRVAETIARAIERGSAARCTVGWRYHLLLRAHRLLPPLIWDAIAKRFARTRA